MFSSQASHLPRAACLRGFALLLLAAGLLPLGCRNEANNLPSAPPAPSGPVRVLVVDDEPLADAISRQWKARSSEELEVATAMADELTVERLAEVDVVVYPPRLLGQLAEAQLLEPLSDEVLGSEQVAQADIFSLTRRREIAWGRKTYALPFGSPPLVLGYRTDVFEARGLMPPRTWAEYQALLPQLADAPEGIAANEWTAACEPLAPGWAALALLARAAPYAKNRTHYSTLFDIGDMRPLIATAPYQRALAELAAAALAGPAATETLTPHETRLGLARGQCALAWTWLTPADAELDAAVSETTLPLAFVMLPGSPDSFNFTSGEWEIRDNDSPHITLLSVSGRIGSVTRRSRRRQAAGAALSWLTSQEWSPSISPKSEATTLFRQSQISGANGWVPAGLPADSTESYAQAVAEALSQAQGERGLVLPGGEEYLAALDAAVRLVIVGEVEPQGALESAASEWETITDRLGRESQLRAYRRSLGFEE